MTLKELQTTFKLLPLLAKTIFAAAYNNARKTQDETISCLIAKQAVIFEGYKWPIITDITNPSAYIV